MRIKCARAASEGIKSSDYYHLLTEMSFLLHNLHNFPTFQTDSYVRRGSGYVFFKNVHIFGSIPPLQSAQTDKLTNKDHSILSSEPFLVIKSTQQLALEVINLVMIVDNFRNDKYLNINKIQIQICSLPHHKYMSLQFDNKAGQ